MNLNKYIANHGVKLH